MTLLALGLLLFAVVHFIPSLAPSLKDSWYNRLGEGGYKGTFSLLLLTSFAMMIFGWRGAQATFIYQPPTALHAPALGLMVVAFLVMGASTRNSRMRHFVRHPQLTGVALWGISHLLLNGDSRSVLLFAGMVLWAIIEMVAISRREGDWIKDEVPSWGAELVTLSIAAITVAVLVFIHPWISGMPVF
jgi:uncharacterized membrane protein